MIKKYNISVPKRYVKDGQEKTLWQNVGVMTEFIKESGEVSRKIEIPAIGLDAQVFEFKDDRAEKPQRPVQKKEMTAEEEWNQYGTKKEVDEEVNVEDVPY